MRIPESKIEEIRETASVVDVISDYVQLRKRGKNYVGLCPFHTEKTPSFTVNDEKQLFHCFGCHVGGNVYKFLMEYKKISFVESVQEVASQYGIELAYDSTPFDPNQSEQEILYDINTEAARYFLNNLLNDEEGEVAREYFEKRFIKTQTIRTFGLGYALNGWENFLSFAKSKNIDLEKALQLGLLGRNNDGRMYDKFAGRIIFPIFSPNGRVVAFAGRLLEEKQNAAKYLNSPESLVYHKSRILYGLSLAKDEIRRVDKAIVVEGYMDLIALYQHGIKNVVAVSGTAFTDDQAQLLSRYSKNAILLFDADTAGIKASMRSIEVLLKKDFEVKIATLPSGEDPDSYVNKHGKDKFEDVIKRAENFLEYQTAYFQEEGMFDDAASSAEAIRELMKPVAIISDELKRSFLIKSISKKFNLREKLLEAELEKVTSQQKRFEKRTVRQPENKQISEKENIIEDEAVSPVVIRLEREIIRLLFEGESEIVHLFTIHLNREDFDFDLHRKIAEQVFDIYENDGDASPAHLISKISDEESETYLRELTLDKYSVSNQWENIAQADDAPKRKMKYARDLLIKFKLQKIDEQISSNHKLLEENDNEKTNLEIMTNNKELEKEKKRIKEELTS